jgi:hypothetical protein
MKIRFLYIFLLFLLTIFSCDTAFIDVAGSRLSNLPYDLTVGGKEFSSTDISMSGRVERSPYTLEFVISNPSSDDFTVKSFSVESIEGSFYIYQGVEGTTLSKGESATGILAFAPVYEGDFSATLTLDTDWSEPLVFNLSGEGVSRSVYVATSGSDSDGLGTPSSPYLTLEKGISEADEFDTLYVAAGTYTVSSTLTVDKELHLQGSYTIGSDGSWSKDLNSDGTGLARSSIITSSVTADGDTATVELANPQSLSTYPEGFDQTLFQGFTVYGPYLSNSGGNISKALQISAYTTMVVENNLIGGSGETSIALHAINSSSFCYLIFNKILGSESTLATYPVNSYAVYLENSFYPVFLYNYINGGVTTSVAAGIINYQSQYIDFYGNIVYSGNSSTPGAMLYGLNSLYAGIYYLINNTFVNGGDAGSFYGLSLDAGDYYIYNNLFTLTNSPSATNYFLAYTGVTFSANTTNLFDSRITSYGSYGYDGSNDIPAVNSLPTAVGNVAADLSTIIDESNAYTFTASATVAQTAMGTDLTQLLLFPVPAEGASITYPPLFPYFMDRSSSSYFSIDGTLRTGDGSTGWSVGPFEVD